MSTSRMITGAVITVALVVAIAIAIAIVAGSQTELRLAPKGGMEPIPTWWLNGEPMPSGWDCGQSEGGSCHE